ncbi:MAG: sugar phosphate isomerase/epimerase family protein, partial [Phycisphaeraceae bacterium]
MLIGAMNHPQADVIEEIQWMAEMGLGFLDLTLEPPAATPERIEVPAVADALDRHHMAVVGHTAHYLPIASPIESVRRGAMTELRRCLEVFAELGAEWVNVHPDPKMPMYSRKEMVARNLESLKELQDDATRLGVGLMVENISGHFNTVDQLGELLEPMPELALHLDIGHSNLEVPQNTADDLIRTFKD